MASRDIDPGAVKGRGPSKVDVIMERVGIVMIPLGVVFILLGWSGASKTAYDFEQIPYLISGGLLGVGLMVTGGVVYLATWVARLVASQNSGSGGAAGLEGAILTALSARAGGSGNGGKAHAEYVATPYGTMFHRPDCAIVTSRDDLRAVDPDAESGFRPCGMCDPLAETVS